MPRPHGYKVSDTTKRKLSVTKKALGQRPAPYERNPDVAVECKVCKNAFLVNHARRDIAKYCSKKCYSVKQKEFTPHNKGKFIATSYGSAHYKVRAVRGTPSECEDCGTTEAKRFEWANLTGNYQDVNDYRRLCTSCHNILDKKILNIKRMRYEVTDELTDALKKLKKVK